MNDIGGERGGKTREVKEGEFKIWFTLSRYQVYAWGGEIQLLS